MAKSEVNKLLKEVRDEKAELKKQFDAEHPQVGYSTYHQILAQLLTAEASLVAYQPVTAAPAGK